MDKLLEKIDSYNIFNYLVPGAIAFEFVRWFIGAAPLGDILTRLLAYYLTGLTVSRVGSIILEPALKFVRLVKHSDYNDYVVACQYDDKIELFVEIANMYRTIYVGSLLCLATTWAVESSTEITSRLTEIRVTLIAMILLFFLAYRKQSNYINKRVLLRQGGRRVEVGRGEPSRE
jgi:hypothetical protein